MTCEEFLALHSEYLDEELGAEAAAGMRRHIAGCIRCARYDRVLRRGLALVRELEPVRPSTDDYVALQDHLARTTPAPPELGVPRGSLAATIAVAGVVALIAWSVLFRATGVPGTAAGASVAASGTDGWADFVAEPDAQPMGIIDPGTLSGVDVVNPLLPLRRVLRPSSSATLVPADARLPLPGPYSPLLLLPPDFGQGAASPVLPADRR